MPWLQKSPVFCPKKGETLDTYACVILHWQPEEIVPADWTSGIDLGCMYSKVSVPRNEEHRARSILMDSLNRGLQFGWIKMWHEIGDIIFWNSKRK